MTAANQVAEANIRYLVETSGQNVPPGYSHTEIGVIPKDWSLCRVGDLAEVKRGAGSQVIQYSNESNGVRFIRINDFFENQPVYVKSTEEIMKFSIGERDILFAGTGNTAGASFIPKLDWIGLPHSYNAPRIRIGKNTSKEYVFHALQSEYMRKQHIAQFVGAAQPFLDTKAISGFFVAVPIDEIEQTAIANALSDADTLINELEKLIAKKQAIKTATMQQLLTGRTRLLQFALREDGTPKGYKQSELGEIPEDWEVKRIGELANVDPENLSSNTPKDYEFDYISLEQIDQGLLLGTSKYTFAGAPSRARRILRNRDVLISTVRPNLMSHYCINGEVLDLVCSTGFSIARCNFSVLWPEYLYQHLFSSVINSQIETLISGSNYPAINSSDVKGLKFPVGSIEEQTTIADILSDMDTEIQTLQKRLAKTRQIKQGMMQELLTGKTRLIQSKPSLSTNDRKEYVHEQ